MRRLPCQTCDTFPEVLGTVFPGSGRYGLGVRTICLYTNGLWATAEE